MTSIAGAQPAAKMYRIGVLSQGDPPQGAALAADFRQGLRDGGYVEGRNVALEFRYASGSADKLADFAGDLVRQKVDVIVTVGDPGAFAAKRETTSIPIVATEFGVDPVKAGLVSSLGRPDGNVTGVSSISEELWPKRLALLREIVPKVSRIAVLWNPTNPGNASCLNEIQSAALAFGMKPQPHDTSDRRALDRALTSMTKDPPDAIMICWDSATLDFAKAIAEFALKRRLPTMAPLKEYVQAGSLISFGTSLPAHRRRAAYYVDKILKGAKPADLPVERPTHFELVVNLATAKALGIALPPGLVVQADDLIE